MFVWSRAHPQAGPSKTTGEADAIVVASGGCVVKGSLERLVDCQILSGCCQRARSLVALRRQEVTANSQAFPDRILSVRDPHVGGAVLGRFVEDMGHRVVSAHAIPCVVAEAVEGGATRGTESLWREIERGGGVVEPFGHGRHPSRRRVRGGRREWALL